MARGDPGINKLDAACKEHDIAYANFKDNNERANADQVLAVKAWERFKSTDSSLGEKGTAWLMTNIIKAKRAMGGGRGNTSKVTAKSKQKRNQIKRKV